VTARFDNTVQRVINSIDQGFGLKLTRVMLFFLFVICVFGFYAYTQFRGLRDPEAMEYAQLARNMATGKAFVTGCVRPADFWYVEKHSERKYRVNAYPDIRHPPFFPALLSLGFRIFRPSFTVEPRFSIFAPEKQVIVPLCMFFVAATGLLVFLIGRKLFDTRVALVAVLIYFLTDAVLVGGISGTPLSLVAFLASAASYAALVAASGRSKGRSLLRRLAPFTISGLLCALAFLTSYAMVALVPVLALFLGAGFDRRRRLASMAFVLIFTLAVAPWLIRNRQVSGGLMGLAPYSALSHSLVYEGDAFDRDPDPEIDNVRAIRALKLKFMSNFSRVYDVNLRTLGGGLIICFFLVSFFHKFDNENVNMFRWCVLLGVLLLLVIAGLAGGESASALNAFLPLIILYGTAFFFVMTDRADFINAGWQTLLTWIIVLLTAVPTVLRVAGPAARAPYPPYFPPFVSYVCNLLDPDETVCTDIPWATAWYGDRSSILLPRSLDDFYEINDSRVRFSGLYLTTETRNKPYTDMLADGAWRSWLPILNGMMPPDFPLPHGIDLPPGTRTQLFLTDRVRWKQRNPGNLAENNQADFRIRSPGN